jgi:hypothetical protein
MANTKERRCGIVRFPFLLVKLLCHKVQVVVTIADPIAG